MSLRLTLVWSERAWRRDVENIIERKLKMELPGKRLKRGTEEVYGGDEDEHVGVRKHREKCKILKMELPGKRKEKDQKKGLQV